LEIKVDDDDMMMMMMMMIMTMIKLWMFSNDIYTNVLNDNIY
jgi:hypothetical protein